MPSDAEQDGRLLGQRTAASNGLAGAGAAGREQRGQDGDDQSRAETTKRVTMGTFLEPALEQAVKLNPETR